MVDDREVSGDEEVPSGKSGWSKLRRCFEHMVANNVENEEKRSALRKSLHPETMERCESIPSLMESSGKGSSAYERPIKTCLKVGNCILLNNMGALKDADTGSYFDYYVAGLNAQDYRDGHERREIDYSEASDEELAAARAVLTAVCALEENPGYRYVDTYFHAPVINTALVSPLLRKLIERRPQQVDQIISLLKGRSLPVDFESDIDEIESLLDSSAHNAVIEGVL